jgi:adenine-specific DNA-methyltransferase
VEHSIWLGLMRDRLELLHRLLSNDGTLFVHIDDNEMGYLIVVLDEIFGRSNRINVITFKQGAPTGHKAINPGVVTTANFILIYAKDRAMWTPNRVYTARGARDKRYNQWISNSEDDFSKWKLEPLSQAFANELGFQSKEAKKSLANEYEDKLTDFVHENADRVVRLARPDYDAISAAARELVDQSKLRRGITLKLARDGYPDMYFLNGERILFYIDKLKTVDGATMAGDPLTTIWDDVLSNNLHNEGGVSFPKGKKPEALIKLCLELSTNPGDLVLDSFAGSGTTGAVAHKMYRRWIMVELRDHCHTHIIPRLKRVIEGADPSGITNVASWKGCGGFRYYRLAPSLLQQDKWGNWVINKEYKPEMLAEAVCKLEGFTYAPSDTVYWQHGHSTERDFIYVTTQNLSHDQLQQLSDDVGPNRTLLVMCTAFRGKPDRYPNLTIKKIPKTVLSRCEWGKDDYSLQVENLPKAAPPKGQMDLLAADGDQKEDREATTGADAGAEVS